MRIFAAFLTAGASILLAQTEPYIIDYNRHGWYTYSGDHRVAGRWGVHFDGQWRRAELITRWQQFQLRPAVNYQASPNVLLTTGYAYTRTYPYGEFPVRAAFPEHRIYEQAMITQRRKTVTLSHRIRFEQRFIRYPQIPDRSWTYQNRFRYMLRGEVPIARDADDGRQTWFVPISNEILIGIPPNYGARPFDQNRLYVGIGRTIGKSAKVEVGYLNQFLGQRNGRIFEFNSTLFVGVISTLPLTSLWGGRTAGP